MVITFLVKLFRGVWLQTLENVDIAEGQNKKKYPTKNVIKIKMICFLYIYKIYLCGNANKLVMSSTNWQGKTLFSRRMEHSCDIHTGMLYRSCVQKRTEYSVCHG